jgi:LPXTG-motif cell wall-anchored protein
VQPPTGNEVILEDTDIFIGEDDNSGGGSEDGLDASRTYDLTDALAAFEPHPEQGWHVKLTVHADGSQGADVKHKVFWVTGCETPPSTTTTTESTTTTTEPTTTTESTTTTEPTTTTSEPTTTTTVVPSTTTSSISAAPVGTLPKTGGDSDGLLIFAGITLLLGGTALAGSAKLGQRPVA